MPLAFPDGRRKIEVPWPGVHCQIVSPTISTHRRYPCRAFQTGPSPNWSWQAIRSRLASFGTIRAKPGDSLSVSISVYRNPLFYFLPWCHLRLKRSNRSGPHLSSTKLRTCFPPPRRGGGLRRGIERSGAIEPLERFERSFIN